MFIENLAGMCALCILWNKLLLGLVKTLLDKYYYYPHFTDKQTYKVMNFPNNLYSYDAF